MFGLVYHEDFNKYDLGMDHPLISDKPRKTIDFFKQQNILHDITIFQPGKATEHDLLRVHNPQYVERVKQLSKIGGMLSFDTPVPPGIYETVLLVTGGTIKAGEQLLKGYTIMVNPLAGFHHASKSYSSGFCFFNDIAIVIEYLREKYQLQRFLIIDLDVHHANGTQEIYYEDPSVLNISFHQDGRTLYPGTGSFEAVGRNSGEGYAINLPLPPGTGDSSYLYAFNEIVPPLVHQFDPEIIIYQSGVDTHHSDPLADLRLTVQTYYHLAKKITELSTSSCNKLLVLFGGGYNSTASIQAYYNIICGFLGRKDYIKEEKLLERPSKEVKHQVTQLKKLLGHYWDF